MIEPMTMALAIMAGLLLGTLFFGGLWWTVYRAMSSPRPALWFFGSLIVRMGISLAGIYFVGKDDWKLMVGCLVGFIIARYVVIRVTPVPDGIGKESSHAP